MSPNAPLEALVAPLRADVFSGASVIGRTAAKVVRESVLASEAFDTKAFREFLVGLSVAILEAQPAMAPLVSLTSRLLNSFHQNDPLPLARQSVLNAVESFEEGIEEATAGPALHSGSLIPDRASILTLSFSSTVRSALERWGVERSLRITCLESRPLREGVSLARHLSRVGLDVTVAVDAAAGRVLEGVDLVLLGADSLGDRGIVNKVGSLALATLARDRDVPVHLLMDQSKLLPPGFPQTVEDERPGQEIMNPVEGVRVWNQYFELLPVHSVASIVTEHGITSPTEVDIVRSRIPVPPELKVWAQARSQ